mmetsp:Transcript_124416/g.387353  ORF Transcript_124416/g.387353 Transcript_124416/m.387353 type:complete len:244 (+) Transcript_124416:115-846(+)
MGNLCLGELGPAPVTLQIYDAGGTRMVTNVNTLLRAVGTGAFHTGVEVYGKEWSFGFTNDGSSGIFACQPRRCKTHAYRESVRLGDTSLSQLQVERMLLELADSWRGVHYDVLRRNCTHFSEELCQKLGVGPVPAWVGNIALAGRTVDIGIQRVASFRSVKSVGSASACPRDAPRPLRDMRRVHLKRVEDKGRAVERQGKEVESCNLTQEFFGSIKTVQSAPKPVLKTAEEAPKGAIGASGKA